MNSKPILARVVTLLMVIALTACSIPTGPAPVVPTADLKPTFDAVAAEAVQTVVAQMTQNAPTPVPATATLAASPTPANTDTPVATFTPEPPTATPTNTFIPWTNTPRATATNTYSCKIEESSPGFGDDFPPNAPFDGRWKVTNTASATWSAADVDFKFLSGTKFQDNEDLTALDLSKDVDKGEDYTVIIDMTAPNNPGRYSASWGFVRGSNILCAVNITIDVK